MAVATLSIDLEARLARLEGDLARATSTIDKQAAKMRQSFDSVGTSVKGLIASLGAAGAVTFGITFVKGAIDAADQLNDLSKKTGVAVDTLGGIGFAAGQAGGNLESAAAAVGKLNKSLAEAAAGDRQAGEAFTVLGVAVKNLDGSTRNADQVLIELADKFAQFEDGPEKAALALRIFGKAGADIIPLLDDGGRALRENIEYYERYAGVTQDVATKADAFNDTLGKLQLLGGAFSRTLAAELLPALQAVADGLLNAKEQSGGFSTAASALRTVLETLIVTGATVKDVFVGVGDSLGAYAAVSARLLAGDLAGAKAIGEAYREAGEARRKALDSFTARVLDRGSATAGPAGGAPKLLPAPRLSGGSAGVAKAESEYLRLVKAIAEASAQAEEEINTGERLSTYQALRAKLLEAVNNAQSKLTASERESIRAGAEALGGLDGQVKANKELLRVVRERADLRNKNYEQENAAAQANIEASAARLRALLADTPTGQLDALTSDIRFLNDQLEKGVITGEQFGEVARNLAAKIKPIEGATDDLGKTAQTLGLTFASAFEDAIVGGKKFSDILKGLEQDIIRIFARKLITEPLANLLGNSIQGSGSFFSSLFGSANGNAFGPGGVVPFANGGIVAQPTLFRFGGGRTGVMGEAGTEGVLPLRRGRDGKLGVISQGGGGTVQNFNVTVQGVPGQSREDAMQQGVMIGRGLQRAMSRNG